MNANISFNLFLTMDSNFDIVFSGYFGEKGIYFQGDSVSGTLYFDNPQHTNLTGKLIILTCLPNLV